MKTLSREEFHACESLMDTNYFGITSAKVVLNKACRIDQTQNELLKFLQSFEFIVITNRANDPSNNHWLGEKTKAFLTDINVQFSKRVSNTEKDYRFTKVFDKFPENPQILQIAENSFTVSRFLNDPYLPVEKAKYIYADITKNAFGRDGRFFVTFQDLGVIAGFLLFSIDYERAASTIELIAIDQNFTARGIGKSLIGAMEHYVAKIEVETIRVGTQLNNINALRFYTSYGFNFLECNSIYHYWPSKPKVLSVTPSLD